MSKKKSKPATKAKPKSKAKVKAKIKKMKNRFPKMLIEAAPEAAEEVVEEILEEAGVDESADESNELESELNLEFAEDEDSGEDEVASDEEFEASDDDVVMEMSSKAEVQSEEAFIEEENAEDEGLEATSEEVAEIENSELGAFESAEIEDVDHLSETQVRSIVESVLFSTDKPISIALIKQAFKGTQVKSKDIREALTFLSEEYLNSARGFTLDEIAGGFQLRTKADNMTYLRQSVKARAFKLSGPALEVLSIVAYKQPVTKAQIDEIRGVESGHLLRALMEKHLLTFGERSELPGKPMFYETARKFLEIFGLRNLQELPSLSEIDQLIPEGIGEVEERETLGDLTAELSTATTESYSVGEEELLKITDELSHITTSSEFFEKEKERMREKRDQERAQNIREALTVGEEVEDRDKRWLERYDAAKLAAEQGGAEVAFVTEGILEDGPVTEGILETSSTDDTLDEALGAESASEDETSAEEILEASTETITDSDELAELAESEGGSPMHDDETSHEL